MNSFNNTLDCNLFDFIYVLKKSNFFQLVALMDQEHTTIIITDPWNHQVKLHVGEAEEPLQSHLEQFLNPYRITLNARNVNKAKQSASNLPIPNKETLTPKWQLLLFFSKLDLKAPFWQLELQSESGHLTAFHGNITNCIASNEYEWRWNQHKVI